MFKVYFEVNNEKIYKLENIRMVMKKAILFLIALTVVIAGCSDKTEQTTNTHQQTNNDQVYGLEIGNTVPDISITTIDGENIHLSQLTGKPTIVYFFASWCPHCRNDFNAVKEIYNDYKDDINFIAIDLDTKESAEHIRNYKKQFKGIENIIFAPGHKDILTQFEVRYTTTKYALAKGQKLMYKGSGEITPQQWRTLFEAMKDA